MTSGLVTHDAGVARVVKILGSLDALTAPEIRAQLDELVGLGSGSVVLDLTNLATVDSTGVALLVATYNRLSAQGRAARVVGVQGQPREIFQFLMLDQSLPLSDSVEDALARLA